MERILKTAYQLSLVYTTDLPDVLTDYAEEVSLLNAPFGTLMLQVGGLALFFLLITAALAQRSERREIAMLKQRGRIKAGGSGRISTCGGGSWSNAR